MKIVLLESLGISESSLQRHIAPLTEAGHEFKAYPKNTDPADVDSIKININPKNY